VTNAANRGWPARRKHTTLSCPNPACRKPIDYLLTLERAPEGGRIRELWRPHMCPHPGCESLLAKPGDDAFEDLYFHEPES